MTHKHCHHINSKCARCGKPIMPGEPEHRDDEGKRAHLACIEDNLKCPYCLLALDLHRPYVIDVTGDPAHPRCAMEQVRPTDMSMVLHLPRTL